MNARQRYEQAVDEALVLLKQWADEDERLIAENDRLIAGLQRAERLTRPEARQAS